MPGYLFKLVPPRHDFLTTMTDDERGTILAHVGYWTQLTAEGRAIGFGPVADPAGGYGIGLVVADDLAEAEALRDQDPAMLSAYGFRTEIRPMLRLVTRESSAEMAVRATT